MNMACKTTPCWLILVLLGLLNIQQIEPREPKVPCYFIFGDSLVDSGNNNNLSTAAKTNYPPYGIDFPGGPTGRFTNGRTFTDFFAQFLGFENFIPPFSTAKDEEVLQGVNYASGSAGILDETGRNLGINIGFNKQIKNHLITVSRIVSMLKDQNLATKHLNKCLYSVAIGSNDYINNYYKPAFYTSSSTFSPEQYATVLIKQYAKQLKNLYGLGARTVTLSGLGPIGCTPDAIISHGTNGKLCVEEVNNVIQFFNNKLKQLVDELNETFQDAKFIFLDNFGPLLRRVSLLGSLLKLAACCDVEMRTGQCIPNKAPCRDRKFFLFFDNFHPSEAINFLVAKNHRTKLFRPSLKDIASDIRGLIP
ncbi:GDSL esterase/lipase At1g29670-like isoform X2 [Durio zibethinus]|uniref:GDSL esterase/lipase At1g29670-like isoform X2 n=1 Tax=Durio zibethinus TaxID=66656 RepID=A0A6P5WIC1_DURZI|nr:GDSL esterase/lipase At1g29670-like isoform X2 [Durio zibethinus]